MKGGREIDRGEIYGVDAIGSGGGVRRRVRNRLGVEAISMRYGRRVEDLLQGERNVTREPRGSEREGRKERGTKVSR